MQDKNFEEVVQVNIQRLEEKLVVYKNIQEQLKTVKVKEKDFAIHKIYGKVLIKGFDVGDSNIACSEDLHGKLIAWIITLDSGAQTVEVNDLLPLSEATKVLYG